MTDLVESRPELLTACRCAAVRSRWPDLPRMRGSVRARSEPMTALTEGAALESFVAVLGEQK